MIKNIWIRSWWTLWLIIETHFNHHPLSQEWNQRLHGSKYGRGHFWNYFGSFFYFFPDFLTQSSRCPFFTRLSILLSIIQLWVRQVFYMIGLEKKKQLSLLSCSFENFVNQRRISFPILFFKSGTNRFLGQNMVRDTSGISLAAFISSFWTSWHNQSDAPFWRDCQFC